MNKMMIASIASLLATSGLAYAHGGHGGAAHFDRDGNGIVTRDEMRTSVAEHFDKIDTNKDGRLTLEEVSAFGKDMAAKHFAEKDKNGDGQLSRAELPRMPEEKFKSLDKNGDGQLSKDELPNRGGRFAEHAEKRFQHADANGDGAVTRDEALAKADEMFGRLDKNQDGTLTQDELKAGHGHGKHGQEGAPKR